MAWKKRMENETPWLSMGIDHGLTIACLVGLIVQAQYADNRISRWIALGSAFLVAGIWLRMLFAAVVVGRQAFCTSQDMR